MKMPKEFYDIVCGDIKRIEESTALSEQERFRLHRELDGKYQACIKDWRIGMWGTDKDSVTIYYGTLENSPDSVSDNLHMMKAKLEAFKFQMNAVSLPELPATQVNVTTNVSISVTFEQVRSQVEEMSSLTDEQTQEILEKINEIEEAVKSTGNKKTKWEKVKPVLKWLADKSCDVGIALLPLILKIQS